MRVVTVRPCSSEIFGGARSYHQLGDMFQPVLLCGLHRAITALRCRIAYVFLTSLHSAPSVLSCELRADDDLSEQGADGRDGNT